MKWSGKWIASLAVLLLLVALAAAWQLTRDDPTALTTTDSDSTSSMPTMHGHLRSYEFRIETSAGDVLPEEANGLIRGWFEAPARTRWELGPIDPEVGDTMILIVTEGDLWFYDPDRQTYSHQEHAADGGFDGRPFPLVSNILAGAILPEAYASDAELLAAPRETLLGREVAVLGELEQGRAPRDLERYSMLWVDLEFRLVMRERVDAAGGSYEARMVELTLNQDVDDGIFDFEPPAGALEATPEPTRESGPLEPNWTPPPSKFLEPDYVPFSMRRISSRASSGLSGESTESVFASPDGFEMTLRQEILPGEGLLLLGTPVVIGAYEGTVSVRGDETVISWIEGDIKLTLRSANVPPDQLLQIAESMKRAGEANPAY